MESQIQEGESIALRNALIKLHDYESKLIEAQRNNEYFQQLENELVIAKGSLA